jgi:NO-binding membrane sensor protein with MHYT domain
VNCNQSRQIVDAPGRVIVRSVAARDHLHAAKLYELDVMLSANAFPFASFVSLAARDTPGAPFTHDRTIVALSLLVAIAMAFAFLELGERARTNVGARARAWNAAAGGMFGLCVWSPHFIGLLALKSPLAHGVTLAPALASAALMITFGAAALLVAGPLPTFRRVALVGLGLGLCGVFMHYIGMAGLRVEATLSYRTGPALMTMLGAVVGSALALWVAHRLETPWRRIALAFPTGAIASGLHYVDVASTVMTPNPDFAAPAATSNLGLAMASAVVGVAVAIGAVILAASDRRLAPKASDLTSGGASGENVVVIPRRRTANSDDHVVIVPQARR